MDGNGPIIDLADSQSFDWKAPRYAPVFQRRRERLAALRADPVLLAQVKRFYRGNLGHFINDWGVTTDPRNIGTGRPVLMPFLLFPRQFEWIEFVMRKWAAAEPGLTDKSRDSGVTWLACALGCSIGIFFDNANIGYGSRKEEYVDKSDDPKSIFWKIRAFMENLPQEFNGGWAPGKVCNAHMRLRFPATGSTLTGEAGDNIGRGDRTALHFIDESAYLARPLLVDAGLSNTCRSRQDISTPNGMNNPFAQKRHGGAIEVFTFHWRQDPRKDLAWYEKMRVDLDNDVLFAQEVDIDYAASVEGILIPSAWVQSAVDAHIRLGINITGKRWGGFDVADTGKDRNGFVGGQGILIEHAYEWSGAGADQDIFRSTQKVFGLCDDHGYEEVEFDQDGLGAGVRGDARVINEARKARGQREITFNPFRGSGEVLNKRRQDEPGRFNEDYFGNRKAQEWARLRRRFLNTHRAVRRLIYLESGQPLPPEIDAPIVSHDELISISSKCPGITKLMNELSQPTWQPNGVGKMLVDKQPDDTKSPNMGDATMIRFGGMAGGAMKISTNAVERSRR